MHVHYPSDQLPGLPSFRLAVPEGWALAPDPRALATLIGPTSASGYRSNAIVRTHRVALPVDLLAIVGAARARAEYEVDVASETTRSVGGWPAVESHGVLHGGAFAEPVREARVVVAVERPDHGFADLVTLVVTAAASHYGQVEPQVAQLVASLDVADGAAAGDRQGSSGAHASSA
jgi:hypothetical protein